tara:strand:- start:583 stop:3540 length:2958 start_codon:yes stop_codon:yes gene_type:complete
MSIQLVLFPQQYNGQYTWVSASNPANLTSDPNWINASMYFLTTGTSTVSPINTAVSTNPPISGWRGFYTTAAAGYAAVSLPTFSLSGTSYICNLHSSSGSYSYSGVYQEISGLTAGIYYDVTVSINQTARGTMIFGVPGIAQAPGALGGLGGGNVTSSPVVQFHPMSTNNISQIKTFTFQASSTNTVCAISFTGNQGDTLQINSIACRQSTISLTPQNVSDGQVIVDLYEHSPIPLSLSVDDFKKIAEKPQSYSKAFNLPATKRNNEIFANIFDVTTSVHMQSNVFNPYITTRAILKEDGHTLFEGHLQLVNIMEKEGEITYTVNLFSKAISLKSVLGNKTFNDFDGGALGGGLGLSELTHEWNKTAIKKSWRGECPLVHTVPTNYSGYMTEKTTENILSGGDTETNVIKHAFVQWNGDISQQSGGGQNGYPILNHMANAFRPWIKIKYLVDRVIGEAGFTYQSDFMEGIGNYANPQGYASSNRKYPDFKRLFMDFNYGANVIPGSFGESKEISYIQDNDTGAPNYITPNNTWKNIRFTENLGTLDAHGWNTTNHEFVCPQDNWSYNITYSVTIYNHNPSGDIYHIKLARYNSAGTWQEDISGHWNNTPGSQSTIDFSGSGTTNAQENDVIKLMCKKISGGVAGSVRQGDPSDTSNATATMSVTIDPLNMDSSTLLLLRGKIKQWDFLKDLITMFNLVILQDKDDDTKLKIEPYDDIFIDNEYTTDVTQQTHDWTQKVDISEMELKPMVLKKTVHWKYKKDNKDYAKSVYESATGNVFGNSAITTNATIPVGEETIDLKVFASTFCKPLFAGFSNQFTVPQIVNQKSNGDIVGYENQPRILYDVSGDVYADLVNISPKTYTIPSWHGVSGENSSLFPQFLHVTRFPINASARDFNFGEHQLINSMTGSGGQGTPRTIFNEYWAPYYDELYHSDTMSIKIKVVLTPEEMTKINFYDKIIIKNREYRINKIDYAAGELSKVELILMP